MIDEGLITYADLAKTRPNQLCLIIMTPLTFYQASKAGMAAVYY